MRRKTTHKPDDPQQSKRFIDMAREVRAEGSKGDLDRLLAKARGKLKPKSEK